MSTEQAEVRELKEGRYLNIDDEPCKIISISTSKPGKHGEAKARIEVAMIDDEADGVLEPLFTHLRRHGLDVEEKIHLHTRSSAADALVARLEQGHFDLLIMGAFRHPVWVEFLFGGTTASALGNASTPVLISH